MVQVSRESRKLIIKLFGKIDSQNAPEIEEKIREYLKADVPEAVILDLDELEYSTSAGLRIFLRLKQEIRDTKVINAHADMYDVLDMTGFTEMMEVHKAYRVVSVEGCEVIGEGANGKVYRIDRDTILKAYHNPDALPEIQRERELARMAFVAGIPTAIPYDVVKVEGGGYGTVFELLDALSYAKLLARGIKSVDELAEMSIRLLKKIHSETVEEGRIPDMKEVTLDRAAFLAEYLPEECAVKMLELIRAIPKDRRLLHGDYHLKNIMYQNGESLLIDMDTLCCGNPVFELAGMYNAYVGFCAADPESQKSFMGISYGTSQEFWQKSLELYMGTKDPAVLEAVENKVKILGLIRVMRRSIRRNDPPSEMFGRVIDYCYNELVRLIPQTDSLVF